MVDVTVKSDDVDRLVRNIRTHADAKALRRELYSGLNRATKGIRGEMIDVIPAALPRRGGLADLMKSRASSRTTAKSGRWAGVSIRFAARGMDIRTLTGKRLRHPVFGNRGVWVEQTEGVNPDVFADEFEKQKPEFERAITNALDEVARKVTRGV